MTKTLTEQWNDGTLPRGGYYIKLLDGSIKQTNYDNISKTFDTELFQYSVSVKEVLAPVPGFVQYQGLMDDSRELDKAYDKIKRLQEQLKEANEVIIYANNLADAYDEIEKYLEKWGVK